MAENRRNDDEWLTEILDNVTLAGAEGLEPLQQMREMQAAYRALLQHEAERLRQVHGDDHPLVLEMRNRLGRNLATVETLDVEDQLSRIQVAEPAEKESLVHGRITDESSRGLVGFTVSLTDEAGKDLGVAGAKVDSTGYFSVVVPEEQVTRLGSAKTRVYLTIKNRKGEVCERRLVSQTVGPGVRVSEAIALSRTRQAGKTSDTAGSTPRSPRGKTTRRGK